LNKKLNLAVLIDDELLKAYQSMIIDDIIESDFCDLILYITNKTAVVKKKNFFLYDLFIKLDYILFGKNLRSFKKESVSQKLKKIKHIILSDNQDNIYEIEKYDLDVIIDLREIFSITDLENISTYGVWRLMHQGYPNAFWEVIDSHASTKVILERISSSLSGGYILDSYSITTDQKSPIRNLNMISWRASSLLIRNLQKLFLEKESFFSNKEKKITIENNLALDKDSNVNSIAIKLYFYDDVKKQIPSNYYMIKVILNIFKKYLKMIFRKYMTKQKWKLLYVDNHQKSINFSFKNYKEVPLQFDAIDWADPFIIDEGDKSYIFFEAFSLNQKGTLHVITYDTKTESFSEPKSILTKEYHLSYPYIFKYKNVYYMIPETSANQMIDLYRAIEFPLKWEKVKTLIDNVTAVDTTIHYYNNYWWMFTNIAPKKGFSTSDELYIFYCKDFLEDKWIPHILNPIISDSSVARNAGKIIEENNELYRPSQNCSGYYGRSLNLNKIEILNEKEYKENRVCIMDMSNFHNIQAIHTLNSSKRFTIIDANFVELKWKNI